MQHHPPDVCQSSIAKICAIHKSAGHSSSASNRLILAKRVNNTERRGTTSASDEWSPPQDHTNGSVFMPSRKPVTLSQVGSRVWVILRTKNLTFEGVQCLPPSASSLNREGAPLIPHLLPSVCCIPLKGLALDQCEQCSKLNNLLIMKAAPEGRSPASSYVPSIEGLYQTCIRGACNAK